MKRLNSASTPKSKRLKLNPQDRHVYESDASNDVTIPTYNCRTPQKSTIAVTASSKKKASSPGKTPHSPGKAAFTRFEPEGWEEDLDTMRELRAVKDAPVDLVGCLKLVDHTAPVQTRNFQVLVAAMLSSQTKDAKTAEAMNNLKSKLPNGLTPESICQLTDLDSLVQFIKPVCFYNHKAKHIKATAEIIRDQHDGKVPASLDDLLKFPGVGFKMASLVMSCAFDKNDALCVDTHVHRLAKLLQWGCLKCKSDCPHPEHTRMSMESWLPQKIWDEVNVTMVGLGQQMQTERSKVMDRVLSSKDPLKTAVFVESIGFKPPKERIQEWLDFRNSQSLVIPTDLDF